MKALGVEESSAAGRALELAQRAEERAEGLRTRTRAELAALEQKVALGITDPARRDLDRGVCARTCVFPA